MLKPELREAFGNADMITIGNRIGITFHRTPDAKKFFEFLKNLLQNENIHIEIEHDGSRVKRIVLNGKELEDHSRCAANEHDWMIIGNPESEKLLDYALFLREIHL